MNKKFKNFAPFKIHKYPHKNAFIAWIDLRLQVEKKLYPRRRALFPDVTDCFVDTFTLHTHILDTRL